MPGRHCDRRSHQFRVALAVQQLARERGKITLLTGPATTKLTNEECSPTGFHWVFDTYSQATPSVIENILSHKPRTVVGIDVQARAMRFNRNLGDPSVTEQLWPANLL